ncbi:hypothetical protein KIN20_025454 [Parelaphostrongylus tenuis]|uniref:C2H2-type domain-containing protein n=1 Tax=Parelaphostrongylus tenuis TaxID=148309 RepID=A0AAD5QXS4_PARTN|nr:hypothetical protein KIN20_025454 [Parelaphostrongylus tenuis]
MKLSLETQEKKCQTYEANGSLYGSNAIGQTLTVKEEIGENSPTLKEETGNTWVCYATDLLKASSSTDLSGNHVSSHNNVPSNEEKAILHESNSIESQYESRHMMTVKEDIREDSHALKEEIREDPLTSKETTGEFWNHLAAGLLNASSSADVFGSDVPPHDRLLSDEEKVLKILHATDVNLKKEHEKQSAELPEQCVKCGRHYASKFLLQRHLNCDHLDEGFTCGECGRNYRILRALNKHKQVIHRKHLFMCSYEGCDHPGYKCHAVIITYYICKSNFLCEHTTF